MCIGKSGAKNAAIFAAQILSLDNNNIKKKLTSWRKQMTSQVPLKPKSINEKKSAEK